MQPPKQFTAKLENRTDFNKKFVEFEFELVEPNKLEFQAGQYVSMQVDERGHRRPYSITSSPGVDHGFELLLDIEPMGLGTKHCLNLEFGQEVNILAPMGQFIIVDDPAEEELVFVATGSGIAPFKAMLHQELQVKQSQRPITLHWGMRYAHNLFWLDEFEEMAEAFPHFQFHPVISRPTHEWSLSRGRVTDVLANIDIPTNAGYYLCGGQPMIIDVVKLLQEKGIQPQHIHHEKFF